MSDPATLYYVNARSVGNFISYDISVLAKLERLLERVALSRYIAEEDLVALKSHFGSTGAHRTIRPEFLRTIVAAVRAAGGKPFLCDTVRIPGYEYLKVASARGYNRATLGCPVILADGLFGRDTVMVPAARYFGEIGVASQIHDAPAMIVCSHCKGHIGAGFGGAIKNLGMGCISSSNREGTKERSRVHAAEEEVVEWLEERCVLCGKCVEACDHGALGVTEHEQIAIDDERCAKCGRCVESCPNDALRLPVAEERFQRALAEAASCAIRTFEEGKIVYVNFLLDIMPHCDCHMHSDVPIVNDLGILIGDDPVAIDHAALTMMERAGTLPGSAAADLDAGKGLFERVTERDPYLHVEAAAAFGLGTLDYTIEELD